MVTLEGQLLGRWTGKLDGVPVSPLEFYQMVEAAIVESELPDLFFSNVMRREGGWLSPHRIYLRVRYRKLFFDISAIVAGNYLVVSWWLHQDRPDVVDLLAEIPGLRFILERTARAATYFAADVIEHFQVTVHQAVLQVLKRLEENKPDYLPDDEQRTIW
ncbi:hypothetical protein BH20ACI2_BH20ACI2_02110 [soil metagenome]